MRRALSVPGLAVVIAVMTRPSEPATWVVALAGALLAAWAGVPARAPAEPVRRLAALPWFVAGVALEVARGVGTMAGHLLRPSRWRYRRIVEVPYGERTERGAAVSGLVATMSPGTDLVEQDDERRVLRLDAVDGRDPERLRAELDRFYRRFQARVFP